MASRSTNTPEWAKELDDDLLTPYQLIRRRRGWDSETFSRIDATTEKPLDHIDEAVSLIHQEIMAGHDITVLTDFDMDGISAGLVTYAGLTELAGGTDARINIVIPDYTGSRQVEPSDIDHAMGLYPETRLLITCDQATNSVDGINRAHEVGVKVIVTDHHHQEVDCPADVLLNPNATDSTYEEKDICGAQVAFHLISTYTLIHRPEKRPLIDLLAMFAGIGALADVMPLVGQTRHLMGQALPLIKMCLPEFKLNRWGSTWEPGLAAQADAQKTPILAMTQAFGADPKFSRVFLGMSILLKAFVAAGKIKSPDNIDGSFIGFTLAPTFNATRRVEGDMHDSFFIFVPQSVHVSNPSYNRSQDEAAATLLHNNEVRKAATKQALKEMDTDSFDRFISFADAPAGIMGLLASRMASATGEPAVVLNPDTLAGSGRAPMWFRIIETVNQTGDNRLTAQGHEQACGVRVSDDDALTALYEAFRNKINEIAATTPADLEPAVPDLTLIDTGIDSLLSPEQKKYLVEQKDFYLPGTDDMLELIHDIDSLGPFGHGFEYPVIRIITHLPQCQIKTLGSEKQHIKLTTPSGMPLLWWNSADALDRLTDNSELIELTAMLSINDFRDKLTPQGIVNQAVINGETVS